MFRNKIPQTEFLPRGWFFWHVNYLLRRLMGKPSVCKLPHTHSRCPPVGAKPWGRPPCRDRRCRLLNQLWAGCSSFTWRPLVYGLGTGERKSEAKPTPSITSSSEGETQRICELFFKDRHTDWTQFFKMRTKRCSSFACLPCDGTWCY